MSKNSLRLVYTYSSSGMFIILDSIPSIVDILHSYLIPSIDLLLLILKKLQLLRI